MLFGIQRVRHGIIDFVISLGTTAADRTDSTMLNTVPSETTYMGGSNVLC
jgi:hypothetical protein